MVPSVEPPATRNAPLVPRQYRGLLLVAILAGMATAAGVVVLQSLHAQSDPVQPSAASAPSPPAKPSAFGTAPSDAAEPDTKLSPGQIEKAGNGAVVTVTAYDPNDQPLSEGAGYIYSGNGIVVTSYSVIRGASSVKVETATGAGLNVIALMGYNPKSDLAVLATLEGNLTALETGAAEIVQEGDSIVVIGPDNTVHNGTVGTRSAIGGIDLMQVATEATPGSPVLNDHGKVIGLVNRKRSGTENQTFVTPSHYISDLLAEHRVLSFDEMLKETQP